MPLKNYLSRDAIAEIVEESRKGKKLYGNVANLRIRIEEERAWAASYLGIPNGRTGIVVNGRVRSECLLSSLFFLFILYLHSYR